MIVMWSTWQFINDLESDKEYGRWPKSLKQVLSTVSSVIQDVMPYLLSQFLQPSFPGSLRQVARNAFNLVLLSTVVQYYYRDGNGT